MRDKYLEPLTEEYLSASEVAAESLLPELRSATRYRHPPDLGILRLLESPALDDRGWARTRWRRSQLAWRDDSPDPHWPDAA